MGGLSVGVLAALADISGAYGSGTGILLTVMIVYRLYEDIARQHMMDMNPAMRKFIAG
jgi:preprotein translocase subunit SecY